MENLERMVKALSNEGEGLSAYYSKDKNSPLIERFAIYSWDKSLSGSFYNILHFFEVVLRTALDREIQTYIKQARWFDSKQLLRPLERKMVEEVIEGLKKKNHSRDSVQIISKLHFGFWVNLFHRDYETNLWPKLLKQVFPDMPRKMRVRQNIYKKLNRIRELRNRVYHYQPIWHYPDLLQRHDEILEAIHWISPSVKVFASDISQFPEIYQYGYSNHLGKIMRTSHLKILPQDKTAPLISIS